MSGSIHLENSGSSSVDDKHSHIQTTNDDSISDLNSLKSYASKDNLQVSSAKPKMKQLDQTKKNKSKSEIHILKDELHRLGQKNVMILEENLKQAKLEVYVLRQRNDEYREKIRTLEDENSELKSMLLKSSAVFVREKPFDSVRSDQTLSSSTRHNNESGNASSRLELTLRDIALRSDQNMMALKTELSPSKSARTFRPKYSKKQDDSSSLSQSYDLTPSSSGSTNSLSKNGTSMEQLKSELSFKDRTIAGLSEEVKLLSKQLEDTKNSQRQQVEYYTDGAAESPLVLSNSAECDNDTSGAGEIESPIALLKFWMMAIVAVAIVCNILYRQRKLIQAIAKVSYDTIKNRIS